MWRTLFPIFAIAFPVIFGLALLYLYLSGAIGMATTIVASFALAAATVTGIVLHGGTDDEGGESTPSRLRM